jgi:hypothetical protein
LVLFPWSLYHIFAVYIIITIKFKSLHHQTTTGCRETKNSNFKII